MKHLSFILILPLVISFASCKKDAQGCTDKLGSNYDKDVKVDNGECKYAADVLFYYDNAGASLPYTAIDVKFLIDGVSLGASSASLGHSIEVTCDSADVVRFSYDMGKNKSGIYSLEIRSLTNNNLIYAETLNLFAGRCNPIKLN